MANLPQNDLYTQFYNNVINPDATQIYINLSSTTNIDDVLKDCKFIKYNTEIKETHCPISLEELKEGDLLIELPCTHIFLETNIKSWINEKTSCPVCRHNLDSSNSSDNSMRQGRITSQIDAMITYLTNQLINSDDEFMDTMDPVFEIY
jgi:hypothetical protein